MSGITLDGYVEPPTAVDGPLAALPEVSWQTCFWILVTLGLNTMMQPGGRVCTAKSRYSTYLRSSPFFCIADVLAISFEVSYKALKSKTSLRACTLEFIDYRFESHKSVDVIKSLRSTVWMRWLCFILGPLPQVVRLASFKGVPLTQIWGFGFVSSWLSVEILVFISWCNKSRHLRHPHTNWSDKNLGIDEWVAKLIYLAAICQLCSAICIPPFWPLLSFQEKLIEFPILKLIIWVIGGICMFCMYAGILIWCFRVLKPLCERNLAVSQNLLVAFREGDAEVLKFDEWALFLLVVSATSFLSWFGAYCYCYSSFGTVNPGWTAVFG